MASMSIQEDKFLRSGKGNLIEPELGILMWTKEPEEGNKDLDPTTAYKFSDNVKQGRTKRGFTIWFPNMVLLKCNTYHAGQATTLLPRKHVSLSRLDVEPRKKGPGFRQFEIRMVQQSAKGYQGKIGKCLFNYGMAHPSYWDVMLESNADIVMALKNTMEYCKLNSLKMFRKSPQPR